MRSFFILLFGSSLLLTTSCNKAKSENWLFGDISFVDQRSNEPIEADLKLTYTNTGVFGTTVETIDIGRTDGNGFYELRERVADTHSEFKLEIFGDGPYSIPYTTGADKIEELALSGDNTMTIPLEPIFSGPVTIHNETCFDDTDTVWIKYPESELFDVGPYVGCIENKEFPLVYWSKQPAVQFQTKSLKDEETVILIHEIEMEPGYDNDIRLEY